MELFTTVEEVYNIFSEEKKSIIASIKQHFLQYSSSDPISNELKKKRQKILRKCPHCGETEFIVGYGKYKDKQRYKCKVCKRVFTETVNTFAYWLHKPKKFCQYIDCLCGSKSIRQCASMLGISISTSFEWRHKMLSAINEIKTEKLSGIIELSTFQMEYSEKGTPIPKEEVDKLNIPTTIVAARDKSGNMEMEIMGRGDKITEATKLFAIRRIRKDSTICMEKSEMMQVIKGMGYELYQINTKKDRLKFNASKQIYRIQEMIFEFIEWMSKFQRVATKYLQNYLDWYMMLDKLRNQKRPETTFLEQGILSDEAWKRRRYLKGHLILVD